MQIRVRRRAQLQIREARAWWAANRSDAPLAIERELEQTLRRLSEFPLAGAPFPRSRIEGIRRSYLRHVHYHLYYRVTSDAVEILAFWHASRGTPPPI
jgi:plasmid stabilization system protein ParE